MIGSLFSGTVESPGRVFRHKGKLYKNFRGMGSIGAMSVGSADRYFQKKSKNISKYVAEGVEGIVQFKGPVDKIIYQLVGGLKSSMGYMGSKTIRDLCGKKIAVQKKPYIRVNCSHLTDTSIVAHTDFDFGRSPYGFNMWIPMFDVNEKSGIFVYSFSDSKKIYKNFKEDLNFFGYEF